MNHIASQRDNILVRRLSWLFPATYLLHLGEELWGGEGFPQWLSRIAGADLSVTQFLLLNALAWSLMVAGSLLAATRNDYRWLLVTLATVAGINGVLHLLGSLVTKTYSPGVISGVVLWIPLGVITLRGMRKVLKRGSFRAGVVVGMVIHVIVTVLAVFGGRLMRGSGAM